MTTLDSQAERTEPTGSTDVGWAPLLVVLAGTFVTYLDFFIVNVALPSIQRELRAGPAALQFVVAGFGLTFAVSMISGGRLGDLYGRRRVFGVGLALFTITSAACGLAPTAGFLVVSRLLQGFSAALLTPQVLAILGTVYAGDRRAKAYAGYGCTMGAAAVLGQLIGGSLIAADIAGSGWRGIFLINVPIGVIALMTLRRVVAESHGERTSLDFLGTGLITAGLLAIVLPLVLGRQQRWPAWCLICLAVAPVLLALFVVHQRIRARGRRAPLIRLAMFRNRSFAIGTLTAVAFGGVPAAVFFVLALYLQDGLRLTALGAGLVFVAVGLGYFVALFVGQPLAARLGRQLLVLGAFAVATGCVLLALLATAPIGAALPMLAIVGFGIGVVLVPLTATALADVAAREAGAASGVLSTALQLGGALAVAAIGAVYYASLHQSQRVGIDHVYGHAYGVSMFALAGLAVLSAGLAWLLPNRSV
ncbi:MAG: MFS transporter [Sciscionella sp.]|nr:MFS transporter [Sciscionella sp.]